MNTETHITDYFKRAFRGLGAKKKTLMRNANRKVTENHPLRVEIRTTYNIACEVLGSSVAAQMADDYGL